MVDIDLESIVWGVILWDKDNIIEIVISKKDGYWRIVKLV